jgi:hypothetical protein
MENQEVYKINNGVNLTTITHKKGLDEQKPLAIGIVGNIDSVFNWLAKRHEVTVNPSISYVIINRDLMNITLVFNERDALLNGSVEAKLELHPDFKKWGINEGTEWDNKKLSEFVKMNRSCFVDKTDAMKLSAELSNLKVKVDKEVEKSNDNRGNVRQMLAQQVIEMNIPKVFKLNVSIFKGQPQQTMEVEIYVNPNSFAVTLVSPEANDIISSVRDSVIDEQKANIMEIAPDLVIIEQ